MKICVTASEKSLEAQIDPRFGRCQYIIVGSGNREIRSRYNGLRRPQRVLGSHCGGGKGHYRGDRHGQRGG
ncbi:MAG: hypothetical protein QXO32_01550 [Candidatus Bathyarchaeia archaeon]